MYPRSDGIRRDPVGTRRNLRFRAYRRISVAKLAEGKLVHFDLASGPSPKAIDISIDPACDVSAGRNGDREIMRLRYLGFEHEGNLRLYCFQRLTPREQAQTFLVEADLSLFRRHQVHIEEGARSLPENAISRIGLRGRPADTCAI